MVEVTPLHHDDPVRLGGYELVGRLGTGGQGVVFLGRDDRVQVAIKLLHAQLIEDPAARLRFVRELAVVQRVAGFCTAQVLEADVAGDRPYIVSEYVPGPSLQELVRHAGPRTGADLDRLAIGTVTALTAIHRAGIVHRDFKPPNVLMAPDGPRVIDFGIARALDTSTSLTSQVIGTPAYMAPEQLTADDDVGPAADMFTWAATMIFAATGRSPFEGGSLTAVAFRILNMTPDLSPLPQALAEVASVCLAKLPEQRPQAEAVLLRLLTTASTSSGGNGGNGTMVDSAPAHQDPPAGLLHPTPYLAVPPPGPPPPLLSPQAAGPPPLAPTQPAPPVTTRQAGADVPGMMGFMGPGVAGTAPDLVQPPAATRVAPIPTVVSPPPQATRLQHRPHAWSRPHQVPDGRSRIRRTPSLFAGLILATLTALLDMTAFGVLLAPASRDTTNRSAFLLTSTAFALLGLITIVAVAFSLRGSRTAILTVIGTRTVRTALWAVWSLSLSVQADAIAVNLAVPVLIAALLGFALWRAGQAHHPATSPPPLRR